MNNEYTPEDAEIEGYLRRQMTPDEQAAFEARMAADPALNSAVEEARLVHGLVRYDGRIALKTRLQAIHEAGPPQTVAVVIPLWKRAGFRVAAALALVAVLALLWWQQAPGADQLYATHYAPLENKVTTMGIAQDAAIEQGMAHYDAGDYNKALEAFDKALSTPSDDTKILLLYRGICLLEVNQPVEAQTAFATIVETNDVLYRGPARWYRALAHLKIGATDACRADCEQLVADKEPKYAAMAAKLLEDL